jgi:hypothetical protein
LLNSRLGLFTAASINHCKQQLRSAPYPEVTGPCCRVPLRGFSRSPWYSLPAYLCRIAVRSPSISLDTFLASMAHPDCGMRRFHSRLGVEMRERICLSSPPTGLDAYSQNALELPRCVMPLLPPGIGSGTRPACAGQPPFTYPQATPCGANDHLVVPEYQPDVHRLRLSPSA